MARKKQDRANLPKEIRSAKARRDYFVEDTFEAGIVLIGTEVKSLRAGKASLNEGFCRFVGPELFIYGVHIDEYLGVDEQPHSAEGAKAASEEI